jgi:hypothetical protein
MSATYAATRHSLHGLAELVLAGPRYVAGGSMRLRAGAGGIRTWDDPPVVLAGGRLVAGATEVAVDGLTYAAAAAALGLVARPLDHVYHDGPHVSADDVVSVVAADAALLEDALARGDAALRALAPESEPILWPEHFDVAVTVDEVTYGVSPGDAHLAEPYAYVGPWSPRVGAFWNAAFGAARPLVELADAEAVAEFFREGVRRAAADPVRAT